MNRRSSLLLLAAVLPACGLFGGKKKPQGRPGSQPVEPVPYEKLVELLPQLEGFRAEPARGKKSAVGKDAVSVASTSYEKNADDETSTIQLEILDGAYISSVYSPFAVMAHSQGPGVDVHKIPISIDGNPGMEEWEPESSSVTVLLLVARRFVVTLRGSHISPETVKASLHAIDLKKLAALGGP